MYLKIKRTVKITLTIENLVRQQQYDTYYFARFATSVDTKNTAKNRIFHLFFYYLFALFCLNKTNLTCASQALSAHFAKVHVLLVTRAGSCLHDEGRIATELNRLVWRTHKDINDIKLQIVYRLSHSLSFAYCIRPML